MPRDAIASTTPREDVMANVGFIGVGNMGSLMARNLIKAGHSLKVSL